MKTKNSMLAIFLIILILFFTGCTQKPPSEYANEKKNEEPLPTIKEFESSQGFKVLFPTYVPSGYDRGRIFIIENSAEMNLRNEQTMGLIKVKEWASSDSSFLNEYGGENVSVEGADAKFISDKINFIPQQIIGYYKGRNLAFAIEDRKGDLNKEEIIKIANSMTCGNSIVDAGETQDNCCLDLGCRKEGNKCIYNVCEVPDEK